MDKSTEERSGSSSEVKFEDAFELTGHGRFNHLVLITCGLIMLNVSMESVGMSYVITAAECDLGLSSSHKGLVTSSAFVGIISTSFLWGYLSDIHGRRKMMLPATLISAVCSIASSFSTNVWMLAALRVLTGCFVSASSATVYAYLGEMHTNSRRAAAIAWGSVFISFSFIILPGLAWSIIPGHWSFPLASLQIVPWRVFIWSWCVPGLLAAILLALLPESPRYLLSAKGPQEALPVLAKMYGWNHKCSPQKFPIEKILSVTSESQSRGGFKGSLKNFKLLFQSPLLKCVFISHVSMFAVYMLSSGLYIWVPDILNSILKNMDQGNLAICDIIREKVENATQLGVEAICKADVSVAVFPISMTMGLVFALTFLGIGVFINRIGKKTLYSGILIVCGIATVAAVFVSQPAGAIVLLILALCSGCAASILASIAVDVFPTCLRAMAICTMYMLGRSGAAFGSYILGALLDLHCQPTIIAFGVFTAATTFLMLYWPNPEKVRAEMESKGLTY